MKDGKKQYAMVAELLWPEGTRFGASRFAEEGDRWPVGRCHSCGHAIRKSTNWVPLVATDDTGAPLALWVGKDCAQTLFGIKVTGPFDVKGAPTI
jgi:hypothetical protein